MLEGAEQILSNIEQVLQTVIDQMGMGKKLTVVRESASVSIEMVQPFKWYEVGEKDPVVVKTVLQVKPVLEIDVQGRCTGVRNTPSLILDPYAGKAWTLSRDPCVLSLRLYREAADVIGRLLGTIAYHSNPRMGNLLDLHWHSVLVPPVQAEAEPAEEPQT